MSCLSFSLNVGPFRRKNKHIRRLACGNAQQVWLRVVATTLEGEQNSRSCSFSLSMQNSISYFGMLSERRKCAKNKRSNQISEIKKRRYSLLSGYTNVCAVATTQTQLLQAHVFQHFLPHFYSYALTHD
ncbi:unnamed protein product [Ceratitis capitata]|uniref:(Mediterranean fruit fly) hypothetical protein n=1 Tax=Ceratitis capitata TaxID=7213 RepID=A0A811UIT8_CERCA|nr:unnamed protein product [Ceratitis capitata]